LVHRGDKKISEEAIKFIIRTVLGRKKMRSDVPVLLEEIKRLNKLQSSFLEFARDNLIRGDMDNLETYIRYCGDNGLDIHFLANAYDLVVRDTFREQVYFKRHHKYRFSSYDEVAASVYFNEEFYRPRNPRDSAYYRCVSSEMKRRPI